jgi:hypothetical protein
MTVRIPAWLQGVAGTGPTTTVSTSHANLFSQPPQIDKHGALVFSLHSASDVSLPPCYTVCVTLKLRLEAGSAAWLPLRLHRDPCGAATSCRSVYMHSQFNCDTGSMWSELFHQFDGRLTWGAGQSLAILGGAAPSSVSLPKRTKRISGFNGGEVAGELLAGNPEWSEPAGLERLPKARGGHSFLPPDVPVDAVRCQSCGRHEYHVAWLALMDSGFVHRSCKSPMRQRGLCTSSGDEDAHDELAAAFGHPVDGNETSSSLLATMCGAAPYLRRPAYLAFGASAQFIRIYAGARSRAGRLSQRANRKDDHYVDIGAYAGENVTGRGVPPAFVSSLDRALAWLCTSHAALNVSVALISVLTYQRFDNDPVRHAGIAASLRRLRRAGVVVLANGGNCRGWWSSCVGLPWPAVVEGITAVGPAGLQGDHHTAKLSSLVSGDECGGAHPVVAVPGAVYSSGALPVFAAAVLLLLEAMARSGHRWSRRGHRTRHDAVLAIVRSTGQALRPEASDQRYKRPRDEQRRGACDGGGAWAVGLDLGRALRALLEDDHGRSLGLDP